MAYVVKNGRKRLTGEALRFMKAYRRRTNAWLKDNAALVDTFMRAIAQVFGQPIDKLPAEQWMRRRHRIPVDWIPPPLFDGTKHWPQRRAPKIRAKKK